MSGNYPGWGPWPDYAVCPECGGLGQVREVIDYGPRYRLVMCQTCDGLGMILEAEADRYKVAQGQDAGDGGQEVGDNGQE